MKKYFIQLSNKNRSLMTEPLIRGHVAHLSSLAEDKSLHFCGPCEDGTAILIINAHSKAQAEAIVRKDPFIRENYYASMQITEVFHATPENNFLLDPVLENLSK